MQSTGIMGRGLANVGCVIEVSAFVRSILQSEYPASNSSIKKKSFNHSFIASYPAGSPITDGIIINVKNDASLCVLTRRVFNFDRF